MTGPSAPPPPARLDAAYAWTLRLADHVGARAGLVVALAVAAGVVAALVATLVLDRFPNSGDEYAYVYQAETMASGRLWNPAPAAPDLFGSYYVVTDGDRTFGSFPIGWPVVLTGAAMAGVPLWLVNPVVGVLSLVVIVALGRELHGPRIGVLAALVVGTSSFFLFNAASYFSHPLTGLLVLVAALAAARSADGRAVWPVVVGFSVAWAVLARYFTGVVCALPVMALLVARRGRVANTLALVALGGLPWVLVLAGYNDALSGSPWQLTTLGETYGNWFRQKWVMRGFDILGNQLLRYVLWTPPLLVFLYLWGLRRRPTAATALDWMPVVVALSFFPYVNRGGNQYGPRFYYEAFPFLALAVTAAVFRDERLSDTGSRRRFAALAASLAVVPAAFLAHAAIERRVVTERQAPYRDARAAGLDHAIVLIAGRIGSTRSIDGRDLTRNGLAANGPVLFATDVGDAEGCRLNALHYGRALYRYAWVPERQAGTLTPVECPPTSRAQPSGSRR